MASFFPSRRAVSVFAVLAVASQSFVPTALAITVPQALDSLQSDDSSLPSGVTNPKGNIGFLLWNLFWKSTDVGYDGSKATKIKPEYLDGVGTWTQNASGTYLTDTNGKVGIGTTAPTGTLEVNKAAGGLGDTGLFRVVANVDSGSVGASAQIKNSNNGTNPFALLRLEQGAGNQIGDIFTFKSRARDLTFRTTTNKGFEFVDGANAALMTVLSNGNVGIGTTAPGTKLEVSGQIKITGGTPGAGKVLQSDAAGLASWSASAPLYSYSETDPTWSAASSSYYTKTNLQTSGQAAVHWGNLTNVGIASAVATGALSPTDWSTFNAKAPIASPGFTGTPTAPTAAVATNTTQIATTAYVKSQGYVTATTETDPQVGANTANYVPKWNGTALVAGTVFDNGTNVGIGTAAPGAKLDVVWGAVRASGYLLSDAATDNLLVNGDFEMGNLSGWSGFDSVVTGTGAASGNYAAQRAGSNTVLSDDFIPVNPVRDALQLEGYFKKSVAGTTPGIIYFGYIAYDANKAAITTAPCGTYCYFAASGLVLPADGAWHKLSATTTGEGTAYPNFPVGTKYVRVLVLINYSSSTDSVTQMDHVTLKKINNGPLFAGNNFTSPNWNDQHQASKLYTTSGNNFIIEPPAGGNVGVGTTNPLSKMTVYGTSTAAPSSGDGIFKIDGTATNALVFGTLTGSPFAGYMQSGGSGVYPLSLNPNGGNVGIGTVNPTSKLHIEGTGPVARISAINDSSQQAQLKLSWNSSDTHGLTIGYKPTSAQSYIDATYPATAGQVYGDVYFRRNVSGTMTDTLAIKGENGNVGIGTVAPWAKLEVAGQIKITGGTPGAGKVLVSDATGLASWSASAPLYSYTETDPEVWANTTNYVSKWNGSALVAGGLYDNGTNLWVGTATPQAKMHVYNTTGAGVNETFRSQGRYTTIGDGSLMRFTNQHASGTNPNVGEYNLAGIGGYDYDNNWGGALAFYTSPGAVAGGANLQQRMTIAANGKVGVGTTSPTGLFSVGPNNQWYVSSTNANTLNTAGDTNGMADGWINYRGYADGFTQVRNFNVGDGRSNNIAWFDGTNRRMSINNGQVAAYTLDVNGTVNATGFRMPTGAGAGKVLQSDATGLASWSASAPLYSYTETDPQVGANTTSFVPRWNGTALVTGTVFDNGTNLGVGTAVPTRKMDVRSDTDTFGLDVTNAAAKVWQRFTTGNQANEYGRFEVISSGVQYYGTQQYFNFANVNVGIGTTTPTTPLHVYKTALVDNSTNALMTIDGKFATAGVDSADVVGIAFRVENSGGGSQTTTSIGSSYQAGANALLLQPVAGNVGIGTTAPANKLDVRGAARIVAQWSGWDDHLNLYSNDAANRWNILVDNGASDMLRIAYNGGSVNAVNILTNGNVGIGTTTPGNKLQVQGGALTIGTPGSYAFAAGNSNANDVTIGSDASSSYIQSFNSKPLHLNNQWNNTIINQSPGRVLIGTNSDNGTDKLQVTGSAIVSGNLTVQGSVITDKLVNRTVNNVSVSGSLLPDSAAPATYRDIGNSTTQRWNNAYVSGQINSSLATGTSPFAVTSTTVNTNLNADMVDGLHASSFSQIGNTIESAEITDGTVVSADIADATIVNADIAAAAAIAPSKIATDASNRFLTDAERTAWNAKLSAEVDGSTTNEIQTLGTSGNNITLSLGGWSVTAPYATNAGNVASPDGDRNPNTELPTTNARNVRFDFAQAGHVGGTAGNYAGIMTYAPWDGTAASTGDPSYQLAFLSTAVNGGNPRLAIRNGIDSTWNAWKELLTSANYNTYSPTLTGGGASGTWGINITGNAATATSATTAGTVTTAAQPAITSVGTLTSVTTSGPIYRSAAGAGYLNGNYAGVESTATSGAIYSIGGAYVPGTTNLGNMYGIGYGYSGNAGITATGAPASRWGMYVASAGVSRIFMDSDNGNVYINGSYNGAGTGLTGTAAGLSIGGNAATATSAVNSDTVDGYHASQLGFYQSYRDFPSGTLIQTDIDYSVTSGEPWLLEIEGNSYGNIRPMTAKYQGYIYSDTVINHGGTAVGYKITGMSLFNLGGKLCFWFPNQGYWQGYNVFVNSSYDGVKRNRLVSTSNAVKPGGITKEVAMTFQQVLDATNYNTYSPTLTGVGASGTWGISVTGNATTAANSVRAISAGSYGSTEVYGSNGGWSGVRFNTPNSVFMVRDSDSYSGMFKNNATWTWAFDTNGALATGSVPWSLVTAKPTTVAGYGITDFVSGTSTTPVAADATTTNGHYYTNANIALFGQTDGSLNVQSYSSAWVTQIFQDYRTGQIALRGKNNGTWQAWRVGLDSSNYTSYAPTLTGGGASGTWGINISGNAATATSATTATTAGTVTTAAQPNITSVGTLTDAYTSGWFRNTTAGMGLYNQATARHLYSESTAYWRTSSDNGLKFYDGANSTLRGYVYHNASGFGLLGNLGGWGIKIPVGSDVPEATSGFRSTIVYDLDNASYYVDPGSTSRANIIQANIYSSPYSGGDSGLTGARHYQWGYQEWGPWSGTYPDLVFGYHTGLKFGANTGYGGMRFYNDHPSVSSTEIMSIGNGDNNVRVAYALYSPITYDSNNAAYYVDPASTSNMNTVNATAFIYSSDRNLKENIVGLTGSLAKISQLNGYSFDWKSDGRKDLWVIAQEVEKIYPELVATNPTTGFKAVEYGNLVAPIIEAIKELSAKVDALFQKYADQSAKIEEQEKRLEELEKKFKKLENR